MTPTPARISRAIWYLSHALLGCQMDRKRVMGGLRSAATLLGHEDDAPKTTRIVMWEEPCASRIIRALASLDAVQSYGDAPELAEARVTMLDQAKGHISEATQLARSFGARRAVKS